MVELQVTLQQVFVPALTDPQSTEFKTLSDTITTICDTIFRQSYGLCYVQTTVTQFRPVPRLGQDPNTEVGLELEFNATSTVPVPKGSDIVDTLKEAVTNPNSTFNFSVDLNSITVINAPATTTVPATIAITTAPPPVVELQVTLQQVFVPALTDPQSTEFKTLSDTITTICDTIFRQRYGLCYVQTTVTQFRPVPRLGQDPNTEVGLELEFNATSTVPVPKGSDIVETLKEAVTNPNSTFNFSVDLNSITVIRIPSTATDVSTNTTAPPVAKSTARGIRTTTSISVGGPKSAVLTITTVAGTTITQPTGEPATVPVTGPATTTTSVPLTGVPDTSTGATTITTATPVIATVVTAAPTTTTAAATTTSVATIILTTVSVEFTSKGETFISDLSTSSSQAFQTRASLIKTQLEPFYQSAFTSFNSLTVIKFRNGSIINTMNLAFSSSAVPNSKEIDTVLIKAAHNITAFNINPTSVTVNGEVVTSSGISSKTSLFTASCLVVLSLLLSS
eukprot:XP_014033144.1 PREDICTED: mucin-5AC-like [Salmo salar]